MMILEAGKTCPLANECPYRESRYGGPCHGTLNSRKTQFKCDYVVNGKIVEGAPRIPGDQTGRMKVILE